MIFLIVQKKWALDGIKNARRKYKNDLYHKHYKAYDNDDLQMANKPKDVSESDFKDLLKYWNSEKFRLKWRKCKGDRMKMTINHLMLLLQSWDMNTQGGEDNQGDDESSDETLLDLID
ncbi:hypothetical protein H5410_002891 [Solanum commersonii]|uniref:Uncharacterized protein n=1 Tax=Solanum commersonii TaxID=4109 RepID=A0A9J6B367_SOLCO|nr:hypothetical protein H5410_002891 [Solanum commersonii]